MLQPKDLKTGRMYYGSVPFPQINSGVLNPCPDLIQDLVRGNKWSKTPKKGPKYLQKGGVPKTPFLPQFWKQIF